PRIPEITPDSSGASEARAMPRHNGRATRKTTKPLDRSAGSVERLVSEYLPLLFVAVVVGMALGGARRTRAATKWSATRVRGTNKIVEHRNPRSIRGPNKYARGAH